MTEELTSNQEFQPISLLSQQEREAIEGMSYEALPPTFHLSPLVLARINAVWSEYQQVKPTSTEQTFISNLKKTLDENPNDLDVRNMLRDLEERVLTTEFATRIYMKKNSGLIIGETHRGGSMSVRLNEIRDNIDDRLAVCTIHNHYDHRTFSTGDVAHILREDNITEHTCIYVVVTTEAQYILFATKETTKKSHEVLEYELAEIAMQVTSTQRDWRYESLPGREHSEALIASIASRYNLGFYSGEKGSLDMRRVS